MSGTGTGVDVGVELEMGGQDRGALCVRVCGLFRQ